MVTLDCIWLPSHCIWLPSHCIWLPSHVTTKSALLEPLLSSKSHVEAQCVYTHDMWRPSVCTLMTCGGLVSVYTHDM